MWSLFAETERQLRDGLSATPGANIHNLLDNDLRKFLQVNGTPTQISEYFRGRASIAGTTPAGRTRW